MNVPKTLKIGAQTIQVVRGLISDISSDDEELNGAWANWEKNKMGIATDMPEDRQGVALLHEILHLVNIYLPEEEVTYLSESLYQVLHDNKLKF